MTNKEAIVWLKECKEHYGEYHEMCDEALDIAIKALEERPQGEWINPSKNPEFSNKDFFNDCSICGHTQMDNSNFCPNCGANMRGKEE